MAALDPGLGLRQAVEEFNQRRFFECHETLEDLWNQEPGEERRFYQGLLQIGVGYYKIITRPNYRGARSLLETGANYLKPFQPRSFGIDVSQLVRAAGMARQELERLGPEGLAQFNPDLIPTIVLETEHQTGVSDERG